MDNARVVKAPANYWYRVVNFDVCTLAVTDCLVVPIAVQNENVKEGPLSSSFLIHEQLVIRKCSHYDVDR